MSHPSDASRPEPPSPGRSAAAPAGPAPKDAGPACARAPGRGAAGGRRSRADRARQVAGVLRGQIDAGAFPSGMLPDERLLAADFGVSRNTVRAALGLLRDEAVVERRRGVGTVIVARELPHALHRLTGLAETLHPHGRVTNEVRAAETVRPPAEVARALGVPEGGSVVFVERLRRVAGAPLSLDLTYLAEDIGAPLLAADLAGRDLFALIEERTGGPLGSASVTVRAVNADAHTATVLEVPEGAALLTVERLTRLPDGRPVDLEYLRVRGDRLSFRTELDRSTAAGRHSGPGTQERR